jgi:hypothetical protein
VNLMFVYYKGRVRPNLNYSVYPEQGTPGMTDRMSLSFLTLRARTFSDNSKVMDAGMLLTVSPDEHMC